MLNTKRFSPLASSEKEGYRVNLEEMDRIVVFECFGEEFPIHRKEWLEYNSLWQEDYFRFVLQKDIGLLTIYDAKHEQEILWRTNGFSFFSIQDIYQHFNHHHNPFSGFIYGDQNFEAAFERNRTGLTTNYYLEQLRSRFNQAYEYYFKNNPSRNNAPGKYRKRFQ